MSAKRKTATKQKRVPKENNTPAVATKRLSWFSRLRAWRKSLRPRTPHRSFKRTYRRDYVRSLQLPGYMAFTMLVWRTLWKYKATFAGLAAIYAVISGVLVGFASQATYTQLAELIRSSSGEVFTGNVGKIGEAGTLLLASLTGGINPSLTDAQQLISSLLVLFAWLTTVWLLRAFLAGQTPKLRDGFYNSGAPFIPTLLLFVVLLLQLIPAMLATIGISAAMPTGLISQGVEGMLFWSVVGLLAVLSLYWMTSTLIAMVVVTLPGMYPLKALKTAHELVVGRRLRIVLRIVWLLFITGLMWAVIMIPIIILDAWLKGLWSSIEWLPIVPTALLVASSVSVVWIASYIYLLYRKVVDDDTAPA